MATALPPAAKIEYYRDFARCSRIVRYISPDERTVRQIEVSDYEWIRDDWENKMAAIQYWHPDSNLYADNVTYTYATSATSTPYIMMPAQIAPTPVVQEPQDDSPLAWLKSQVVEICELAHAA